MRELEGVGRYEVHGKGRPVVILSNPQADPRWWAAPFVSALTGAGYEAVPFIHTGGSWTPEHVVGDVATFIEHLGHGAARLLGWSQGAAIAQEVALARPDLVAAGALIATYGRQNTFDRLVRAAWAALDGGDEALEPVRLALLLLTGYPPQALGEDSFVAAVVEGARQWSTGAERVPEARRRSEAFICANQDRLSALASITVPCLVMGFALDADTFVGRAREVAQAIPDCRYEELPDAGHLTPATNPERVIAPVLRFLADVDSR